MNSVPHMSTGFCSVEILTGKQPDYKLNEVLDKYLGNNHRPIEEFRQAVKNNLVRAALHRNRQFRKQIIKLQEGDLVLLRTNIPSNAAEGTAHKLALLYDGPYVVSELPYPNTCRLVERGTNKVKGVYNAANLTPYYTRGH